eukprot:m.77098 g.77098  ORF g.77098 m.77098 type:complete len:343 (-) comp7906_c0_seq2:153-1181(-)
MADVGHSKKGKTHKAAGQGPSKRRRLKKAYEAGLDDTCDVELDLAGLDDPLDLHVAALAELRAGNSSVAKSMLDVALARVGNLDKAKLSQRERGVYSLCLLERGTLIDDPVWEHVEEAIQELQPLVKELRDLGKPLDSLQQSFVLALLRAQAFAVTHAEDEAAQRAALASAITTCDTARVLHLDGADVSLAFAGALLADEDCAVARDHAVVECTAVLAKDKDNSRANSLLGRALATPPDASVLVLREAVTHLAKGPQDDADALVAVRVEASLLTLTPVSPLSGVAHSCSSVKCDSLLHPTHVSHKRTSDAYPTRLLTTLMRPSHAWLASGALLSPACLAPAL